MLRLECTRDPFVDLNLNRRMRDPESLLQFMTEVRQRLVARMSCRHHAMASQRDFSRADWPDMES